MQDNPELAQIFADDQADRRGEAPPDIIARDRERLARVTALFDAGAIRSPADHLMAAFVFQHGDRLEHYWQAHELALQAVELGHGPPARWLAAAAYDRWLMHQSLPQKFGTQYHAVEGRWDLYEVDPATSDEERARWDVPPLREAMDRAERMTRESPPAARPGSPDALAALDLPGLRVALVAISGPEAGFVPDAMPPIEPLPTDQPHPLPSDLPEGLEPRRLGEGYCAVNSAGELAVSWFALALAPGETLHLAWSPADGPTPTMQALNLGGRPAAFIPAVWSAVSRERLPLLAVRSGPDSCWLVVGRLAPLELARVAASLPHG